MKKIKYLFSVCFVAVFVFCMGVSVKAEETEIDTSVFEYEENDDGTITITGYTGTDATVTIPSEIDGKSVVSIGRSAFYKCETIRQLVISEGITGIEDSMYGVFGSCKNLETVSLPSTLKTIGNNAFDRCYKLREINLPEGLTSIGDDAFWGCHSIEKLVIPDSVTYIGEGAFNLSYDDRIPIYGNPDAYIKTFCDTIDPKVKFSCINHVHIVTDAEEPSSCGLYPGYTAGDRCADCGTILSGHEVIPPGHIYEWKIIKEATVNTRGRKKYVCIKCGRIDRLEWIPKATVPKKNEIISDLNDDSYKVTKSGTKNGTVEFSISNSSNSCITVPSTVEIAGITYKVTSIAKNAFKNNKNLKKITINGNVTKINANAFSGCTNLKTIKIKSKNLKSVGKNAFKGIHPKAKIKVPSSCLEKYKKLLAKKGQKSSVKITK